MEDITNQAADGADMDTAEEKEEGTAPTPATEPEAESTEAV
jgi:hypothetical protein